MRDKELVEAICNPDGARLYLNFNEQRSNQTQVLLRQQFGEDIILLIDTIVLFVNPAADGSFIPQIAFSGSYKPIAQGESICVLLDTAFVWVGGIEIMTLGELRLLARLGKSS